MALRPRIFAIVLASTLTVSLGATVAPLAHAASTLTVNTTADLASPCVTTAFSLRCALQQANIDVSGDTIAFNIPSSAAGCSPTPIRGTSVVVCTISPTRALPRLTASGTTINGYSQPGAVANIRSFQAGNSAILTVRLDGARAGSGVNGLDIAGARNTVTGLSITGFITRFDPSLGQIGGNGIGVTGSNTVVQGNYVGVLSDGLTAAANQFAAVNVLGGGADTIGGSSPAAFNVLSGNGFCSFGDCSGFGVYIFTGSGTTVAGNYIGTTASGRAKLPNNATGVVILSDRNTLTGNVVSGNGGDGILIGSASNSIVGNKIGTNVTGSSKLGNHSHGLDVQGPNNVIGGPATTARNVISANGDTGLVLLTSGNVVTGNRIGTNTAGTAALGNGFVPSAIFLGQPINGTDGVVVCVGPNTIGGSGVGAGNLISGNAGDGLSLVSSGNTVQGNTIGTNSAGNAALANGVDGVGFVAIPLMGVGFCQQAPQTGGDNNVIGGAATGAGNLISGNAGHGVDIVGNTNQVVGNRIGTTGAITAVLPNLGDGVRLAGVCDDAVCSGSSSNVIGGTGSGSGNFIGGNAGDGVHLDGLGGGQSNSVQGNRIGVGTTDTVVLGNKGNGVFVGNGAIDDSIGGTVLGAGNVIANNAGSGVLVGTDASDTRTHSSIQRNSMQANGELGIDLVPESTVNCSTAPPGPNDYTPCPIISSATTARVSGTACANCTVEVYIASNEADDQGHGEGSVLLGSTTVDVNGSWSMSLAAGQVSASQRLTASATTAVGFQTAAETSEFSANVAVVQV